MLSLVALSGAEFVEALMRGGFEIVKKDGALVVLERRGKTLVVCNTATLSGDDLVYLLRRSGVAYFELLDLLAAGKSPRSAKASGFHCRTDAARAEPAEPAEPAQSQARSLADLIDDVRAARTRRG